MASSLEGNKLLAAILTGGIIVSGAGVISQIIYSPHILEENAFPIAVEAEGGAGDGGDVEETPLPVLLANADPASGEGVAKKCAACHTFEEGAGNKIGPDLYDVVGRDIAGVSDFEYSEALAGIDGVWDYDSLSGFINSPKNFAPGTKMSFAGISKPGDRADLLVYLRTLSADPVPLPEAGDEEAATLEEQAAAESTAEEETAAAEAVGEVEAEGGSEPTSEEAEVADASEAGADTAPAGDGAAAGGFAALVAAADPEEGAKVARKCKACHSLEEGGENKIGPHLWDIVGRDIGTVEDFSYSDVIAGHGGTWDYDNLAAYLENPKEWAPGNKMTFAGVRKEEDRASLVAYLRTLSANPAPLP